MNTGKAVYLEGNNFGGFHQLDPIYPMFGCLHSWSGFAQNVENLTGQPGGLVDPAYMEYMYGTWPDMYMNSIESAGGEIFFRSQEGFGRAVAYAGTNGSYRAIHSCFVFGAMMDASSSHLKKEIMAAYMRYLSGEALVVGLDDTIPASEGARISLHLEAGPASAGRGYAVLGSVTGTSPGFPVGSVIMPLNYDPFLQMMIPLLNSPVFADFLGTLDGDGRGTAVLDTLAPIDPSLAGLSLYFAYLLTSPVDFASNGVEIPIIP